MRAAGEGTESTASLASVLRGQGRFYSLESDEERIESCRRACGGLNQWIRYQEGDPSATLRRLRDDGELDRVHLAFLPSPEHGGGSAELYGILEDLMAPGALLIVDDALHRGGQDEAVRQRLLAHTDWDVRLVLAGRGILVAQRRS
jgi:predicted O-methyltransferase YrrM